MMRKDGVGQAELSFTQVHVVSDQELPLLGPLQSLQLAGGY